MIEQLLDEAILKLQSLKDKKISDVDVQVYDRGQAEFSLNISVEYLEVSPNED